MKKSLFYSGIFLLLVSFAGCLTMESKEYSFKLKSGKSGSGKIKYINIMHTMDSASTPEAEYEDLVSNYLNGNKPEDEMTGVKNVKKRLFEEDNHLCGEITFDFDDITTLKFFDYDGKVWAYSLGSASLFGGSESFFSSNGKHGGENMNVIFWDGGEKEFKFKTTVSQNDKQNESLLDIWKKKNGK